MGCSQSKIENEEAVSRCKQRKHSIKLAVSARNAFAAAHFAYAITLKNCGAALSDFAQSECVINPILSLSSTSAGGAGGAPVPIPIPIPIPVQAVQQPLPPPPPPVPDMPPVPLQRAVSMPEIVVSKRGPISSGPAIEEDVEEEEEEEEVEEEEEERLRLRRRRHVKSASVSDPPPPTPPPLEQRAPTPPPPPAEFNNPAYDYLFNTDDIPNGSLGGVEEVPIPKDDEIEHKRAAPQPMSDGSNKGGNGRVVEEKQPKMVEKPSFPLVASPQQGGGGSVKGGSKKAKQVVRSNSGGDLKRRNLNLVQIFNELDDYFLKASDSAHEVSKILEATRLHFHSNFADNRGHIDHSARVMRVITWNRSFRGLNTENYKDDLDSEENETLATVLDKLLAWEKKLYNEVKSGEIMKFEYQRKLALLNKNKKRGASPETLEKLKAAVSHLRTRYIVDMQAMDATVSEINRLRDEQLYPKLVALVDAMATMWDAMQVYHENQYKIALALKAIDISQLVRETTDHLHERTIQLWGVVQEWHTQFDKMVNHQREYIKALNSWLKLNLVPIETNLIEESSSASSSPQNPRIRALLLYWQDHLEKLPGEHAKSAIHNFAAVLHTIVEQQVDELKLRAKLDESIKDMEKKQRQYQKWLKEYTKKRMGREEEGIPKDEAAVEKESLVEATRMRVEQDKQNYRKQSEHVRQKTLTTLKTRVPEVFQVLSDFARAASDMFINLRAVSKSDTTHNHHRKKDTTA